MTATSLTILGIDPGTATVGFGIIKKESSNQLEMIDFGCIKTLPKFPLAERLNQIAEDLNTIIKEFKPDVCGLEQLFFAKNTKTALNVAHARGVIMQTLQHNNIPVFEYTPLQIKMALTSYGRATKTQIQIMTKTILRLKQLPHPDDAADALATAICHANNM